jgi:hypothetical protein
VFFFIVGVGVCGVWFICILNYQSAELEYYVFRSDIDVKRNYRFAMENAGLTTKIAEWNQRITRAKFLNQFYFIRDFIPDSFAELELLR